MTDKEKAIIMAHTGMCMLSGDKFQIFHKYIEDIMGRPIMTHEIGLLEAEIKEKSKADFYALCLEDDIEEKQVEWTPVSEGAPKASGDYIITVFDPVDKNTFVTEACYSVNGGNWESDYLHFWQRVVAWTPLAKPYKKAVEEYEKIIDKINDQYKEE